MFEVPVTEERDLLVFARGRTIGVVFNGPTGAPDERHEVDLTNIQAAELIAQLLGIPVHAATAIVADRKCSAPSGVILDASGSVVVYPSPSYEDLIPVRREPTVGELGIADPPQLTAADYDTPPSRQEYEGNWTEGNYLAPDDYPDMCGNDGLNACCGGGCHG